MLSGEVTRVPDLAIISAGVVTKAATADRRFRQAATRMQRVRSALKRGGSRGSRYPDEQHQPQSGISLRQNQPPQLTGYTRVEHGHGPVSRHRECREDPRCAGQGGREPDQRPELTIDKPEAALDEARARQSPWAVHVPSFTRDRWGCGSCASSAVSESGSAIARPAADADDGAGDGCAGGGHQDRSRASRSFRSTWR